MVDEFRFIPRARRWIREATQSHREQSRLGYSSGVLAGWNTQGIATFTALQRRGIESRFLCFPDENPWVNKPANSKHWYETVIGWLDQWTSPK